MKTIEKIKKMTRKDDFRAFVKSLNLSRDDYKTMMEYIDEIPSVQPERTEYIPETKAVRSKRDCVDLSELVSATFYDQEHEEWTQQTVTIADVLDSVCDEYTILPSAQPTLCGYNIEHLILIANVLRKENLPPEMVVEALTDIGRIVSIVKDEFEESLRKAVEQCKV